MKFSYNARAAKSVRGFLMGSVGLLTAVLATAAIADHSGLTWNETASLPRGYYKLVPNGPLAVFCPDGQTAKLANERHYRPDGRCPDGYAPLLKPVVARAGDTVTVSPRGIAVNGQLLPNSRQYPYDRQHRPMPLVPPGTYAVAPHTVWVISSYSPASFDSRYYGPISDRSISSYARPFLTF